MFKQYEVLQVYTSRYGEVEDADPIDVIQIDEDSEEFYDLIVENMANIGIDIPHTWDIIKEENVISIYDSKGNYRYQLKDY